MGKFISVKLVYMVILLMFTLHLAIWPLGLSFLLMTVFSFIKFYTMPHLSEYQQFTMKTLSLLQIFYQITSHVFIHLYSLSLSIWHYETSKQLHTENVYDLIYFPQVNWIFIGIKSWSIFNNFFSFLLIIFHGQLYGWKLTMLTLS